MPIYRIPDLKERLRALRGEKTQQEIADVIGVAQSTYALYEKGDREPSLDAICKLADHYNVTTDYLLGTSDCKKADNQTVHDITGLSEDAIEVLKLIKQMAFSDVLSELITSSGFISALQQINQFLALNLNGKYHAIVTKDDLEKLEHGEKVKSAMVPTGTIMGMFLSAAKQDMGKAIEETVKAYRDTGKELPTKTKMVLRALNGDSPIPKEIIAELMKIGKDKTSSYTESEKANLLKQLLEKYDKGELNQE